MARRPSPDLTIGERIKTRRNLFKWSIRHAADRAGISHASWGRIERGQQSVDNRFMLGKIAEALQCSVAELTGLPPTTAHEDVTAAQAAVFDIRRALVAIDLGEDPVQQSRDLSILERETDLLGDLRARCDYAGAAPRIPVLLTDLHAATRSADRSTALRLLTLSASHTAFVTNYIGFPGEAWLAADRSHQAAEALEDPVMLGISAFARSHAASCCGDWKRALKLAHRAAAELEPHIQQTGATEVLGQLHLSSAYALYALSRRDEAMTMIAAASDLADRTGETNTFRLMFGPTNIRFWEVSMEVDGGDPGRAVEIGRKTNAEVVDSKSRKTAFYFDLARALARIGRDEEAVRMLISAERQAPQRVRSSPLAAETARALLERSQRNAISSELRGFAERVGVTE